MLLLTLPFLASLAFGQDTLDLKFRPKVGETRKYESSIALEVGGAKVDLSVKQTGKILEVATNGDYKQEVTTTEQKLLVNGEEQDQPAPPVSSHKRTSRGDLLEVSSKLSSALSQCLSFLRIPMLPETPSKVGDKWSREFKKDEKLGTTGCTLKYEFLSKDKVGAVDIAKIKVSYESEEKGTATGELWVRISDGTTVQLEAKFEGVAPAEGAPDAAGTVKLKLVEG